jgi:predicted O-methyltransferase YrrM
MDAIETVNAAFGNVPYMLGCQAVVLRNMIVSTGLRSVLELGCAHGKGTCYLAAIMEERGGTGQVTTLDKTSCLSQEPNVHQMLAALNLAHRVSVILEPRSFTMALLKMFDHPSRPKFDLCFFDGGHSWDETGYAFLLIDKLLTPGAWVIFDDLNWTMADAPSVANATHPEVERRMRQVRKVWEILVPEANYINRRETALGWGIAQKP